MKSNSILFIALSLVLLFPLLANAQNDTQAESVQNKKVDQDEEDPLSGADVTIRKEKDRTIEEYRVNGQLLQIKIIPKLGYPYYLIDTDADGVFETRSSEAWSKTTVNTWKIFKW